MGRRAHGPARVFWFSAVALAIALVTPIVRIASFVASLPLWVQWYIRPAADLTIFTLFPWAAFVFAGGAVGALIAAARDERSERRLQACLALAGAALVALGFYTAARPSMYRASSFWTSSPTWFTIRVGIMMISLAVIYAVASLFERAGLAFRPLERFGQHSLFIYWIHVELVYGYASWLWWGPPAALGNRHRIRHFLCVDV